MLTGSPTVLGARHGDSTHLICLRESLTRQSWRVVDKRRTHSGDIESVNEILAIHHDNLERTVAERRFRYRGGRADQPDLVWVFDISDSHDRVRNGLLDFEGVVTRWHCFPAPFDFEGQSKRTAYRVLCLRGRSNGEHNKNQ